MIGLPKEGFCDFLEPINYPGRPSKADTVKDARASLMHRANNLIRRCASCFDMASHRKFAHDCLSSWSCVSITLLLQAPNSAGYRRGVTSAIFLSAAGFSSSSRTATA